MPLATYVSRGGIFPQVRQTSHPLELMHSHMPDDSDGHIPIISNPRREIPTRPEVIVSAKPSLKFPNRERPLVAFTFAILVVFVRCVAYYIHPLGHPSVLGETLA